MIRSLMPRWRGIPRHHKLAGIVVGLAVTVGLAAGASDESDDDSEHKVSALEAACDMLNDGETSQFTYEVMVDVMKQYSYTYDDPKQQARAVVRQAQEQGCGS